MNHFNTSTRDDFYVNGKDVGRITGCELFFKNAKTDLDWTIQRVEVCKSCREGNTYLSD